MKNNGELIRILKRFGLFGGIILAMFSVYFSWDGLDNFPGNTISNSEAAVYIGAVVAIIITLLQFIFNTDFKNLNLTLKILGAVSYVYSVYTNFIGIQHIFGFTDFPSAFGALIMDVLPEALIAWALGEHLQGDFFGNLIKMALGTSNASQAPTRAFNTDLQMQDTHPRMPSAHQNNSHKGKGSERRQFFAASKSNKESPNRFFGE